MNRLCSCCYWIYKNIYVILPTLFIIYFLQLIWNYYIQDEVIIELREFDTFDEPDLKLVLGYKFTAQEIIYQGRTTDEKLNTIKNYIKSLKRRAIPKVIQDETLVLFLIACKNDVELTKRTIISHYECKRNSPEIFDVRNIENNGIQLALKTLHMFIIQERTDENVAIAFFKVNDVDYNNFDCINIMKASSMLIDIAQERNPPDGIIIIIDAKGLGLMHITKIRTDVLQKYAVYLQEGIPLKVTAIHVLNTPRVAQIFLNILKHFVRMDVLTNLLHLHRADLPEQELFELFPKKYWPKEYNGDLPSESDLHNKTLTIFYRKHHFWELEEKIRKQYY